MNAARRRTSSPPYQQRSREDLARIVENQRAALHAHGKQIKQLHDALDAERRESARLRALLAERGGRP